MTANVTVFVEGISDRRFLCCLLSHAGLSNFEIDLIPDGKSGLSKIGQRMQMSRNDRRRIAVILDADKQGRKEIESEIRRLNLPVDRVFLMPDDESPGCLENLLEKIEAPQHAGIHDCFSRYEACLETAGRESQYAYRLPNLKARIYAYCEAVGNGPKENERDYAHADHWDLDARALNPLKKFLRECAAMAPPNDTV